MLFQWLKQIKPHPTWTQMVAALKECTVNEIELAKQVESKYATETQEREFFG
jgi:hypothetical protein